MYIIINLQLVLYNDGTEIDDDEILLAYASQTTVTIILTILNVNETMEKVPDDTVPSNINVINSNNSTGNFLF